MGVLSRNVHQCSPQATNKVKALKFNASWVDQGSYGLVKARTVVFELGLGPCGRHVTDLSHTINEGLLTVTQWSRDPEKLTPPDYGAALNAQHKVEVHNQVSRTYQPTVTVKGPPRTCTSGWWIFKSTMEYPHEVQVANPEKPEGLLEDSELASFKALATGYHDTVRVWEEGVEIKTFVYKMADIHGRIEVLK